MYVSVCMCMYLEVHSSDMCMCMYLEVHDLDMCVHCVHVHASPLSSCVHDFLPLCAHFPLPYTCAWKSAGCHARTGECKWSSVAAWSVSTFPSFSYHSEIYSKWLSDCLTVSAWPMPIVTLEHHSSVTAIGVSPVILLSCMAQPSPHPSQWTSLFHSCRRDFTYLLHCKGTYAVLENRVVIPGDVSNTEAAFTTIGWLQSMAGVTERDMRGLISPKATRKYERN